MSAVCYSSVFTVALTCQQIKHAKKWCRRVAEQCADIKGLVQEIEKKDLSGTSDECARLVHSISDLLEKLKTYLQSLQNHGSAWWVLNKSHVKNKLEMQSGQLQDKIAPLIGHVSIVKTYTPAPVYVPFPSIVLQQNVTSDSLDITDYCGDNGSDIVSKELVQEYEKQVCSILADMKEKRSQDAINMISDVELEVNARARVESCLPESFRLKANPSEDYINAINFSLELEAFFQWNSDTYEAKLLKWYRDAELTPMFLLSYNKNLEAIRKGREDLLNNEITGKIYTKDHPAIKLKDTKIKEIEEKIQAREKILKNLPKFEETWGTLTDLTDRLSKRVTALKQTVESLTAPVDSRVQLLNELSGIKLNDSKEMKALFARITFEGTQALGENDNWLRVRVNKEALRNSARAVIDQCKGIMAERRAERRHKELIDIASQPPTVNEQKQGDLKEEIRSTFQLLRQDIEDNAKAILKTLGTMQTDTSSLTLEPTSGSPPIDPPEDEKCDFLL